MNKYTTLESTIRSLGAKSASQALEKDMNDQVHAGSYSSKHFEVSRPAQKLFASLPKNVDSDKAEKSLQLHDKLFAIHKKTKATERSTDKDVDAAQELHDQIMALAKEMGLEDKHSYVKDSLDFIKQNLDTESNTKDDINPDDAAKRFATPPKDYQSDVKNDADIDNMAKFHISRDKRAQRKLKIIDDQYIPGVTEMDRIENLSPSFLEALKQVQENEKELTEKKKMTKADIAALKEPKGKIDANDLAALRAGEHKKKKVDEETIEEAKHNNTPAGVECPVCGMKACPTVKEEATAEEENIEEGVRSLAKSSRTLALKKKSLHASRRVSKASYKPPGTPSKEDMRKAGEDAVRKFTALGRKITREEVEDEIETLDEAQFIVIQKGMEKKRIRNNPAEIMQARKDGWAINEETETVEEGNEMQNLAKSQASAVVKREVQQKKAMFAKKDSVDKAKFSKAMQNIKAGDEVEVDSKTVFMERAIAILGEEFADASYEALVEEIVKRGRGRPRKDGSTGPKPAPTGPKRGRGRPRKDAGSAPAASSSTADTDKDREHIVMGLRKAVSLRGEHPVKFADGSTHKIPAEHAQRALKMHDSLSKPSEKMTFARKLAASHDSFKKALQDKNPGAEETKKTGITLAKRAD